MATSINETFEKMSADFQPIVHRQNESTTRTNAISISFTDVVTKSDCKLEKNYSYSSYFFFDAMIEIKAEILRGPVFIAGEKIHCQITFTNRNTQDSQAQ